MLNTAPPSGDALPLIVATFLLLTLGLVVAGATGPDHASWRRPVPPPLSGAPVRRLFTLLAMLCIGAVTLAVRLRPLSLLCIHRCARRFGRVGGGRERIDADRNTATLKRLAGLSADPSQVAVSHIAHRLALQAGIAPDDADELRATTLLYQIGRVGMPAALLCKHGPLDHAEQQLLRRQPAIGARLLADGRTALLDRAAELALCHQERWNGTGYPRGLSGPHIPLPARIVTIAAAFDALLRQASARPLDQLALHMSRDAGRLFDPDLVRILLSDLPAMLASRNIAPAALPPPRPLGFAA